MCSNSTAVGVLEEDSDSAPLLNNQVSQQTKFTDLLVFKGKNQPKLWPAPKNLVFANPIITIFGNVVYIFF